VVTFPFAGGLLSEKGKIASVKDIIRSDPHATIPHMAKLTGRSERTISRELSEYRDKGEIIRVGARKNGKWMVTRPSGTISFVANMNVPRRRK